MIYRQYGKTDKKLSVIGFGGMRFDNKKQDHSECADIVKYALNAGINYFDTAPYYCDDESEIIFGKAFKNVKRDSFYLSTKCNTKMGSTKAKTLEWIKRSLDRLDTAYIDIFHAWCILEMKGYEAVFKNDGLYEGMLEAKELGLIKTLAFSTHMNGNDIASVADSNAFEGVTLGYNAINFPFREAGIEAMGKNNKGVVIMNPLSGGQIANFAEKFDFLKAGNDDVVVSSLKFLTSNPNITSIICGFNNIKEIDHNLKATENIDHFKGEFIENYKKNITSSMDKICTCCSYCDECPKKIPVYAFMDSYNSMLLLKSENKVFDRLKSHFSVDYKMAKSCISCGKCEKLCPQKLPIIERLKEIAKMKD